MDFTVEMTFADSSNGAGRSKFYLLVFFSFLNRTFAKNPDQFRTNLVKKDRTWAKVWKSRPS